MQKTIFVISAIVIGNLLLAGIVGGGYIYMKRKREKLIDGIDDELKDEPNKKEDKQGASGDKKP